MPTRHGGRNWGRLPGKGARGRKREYIPGFGRGVGDTSPAGEIGHLQACLQQSLWCTDSIRYLRLQMKSASSPQSVSSWRPSARTTGAAHRRRLSKRRTRLDLGDLDLDPGDLEPDPGDLDLDPGTSTSTSQTSTSTPETSTSTPGTSTSTLGASISTLGSSTSACRNNGHLSGKGVGARVTSPARKSEQGSPLRQGSRCEGLPSGSGRRSGGHLSGKGVGARDTSPATGSTHELPHCSEPLAGDVPTTGQPRGSRGVVAECSRGVAAEGSHGG